ncbi:MULTISPECIES: OapC/ArvC family zinc-ribbon domain-containing protein [Haloferacaceae]|uniref:Zn-ribbon containing protein n=1 Tax=Halorubrum glutamatedens TaxID=2707018 RepID=A0ABD5QSF2_9EURY|nr:Zn-ribbon containing protein [Halobellus captivus]
MPHQCIECGRTFPDGSKEMLSGCPDCGGNKFQFKPSGAAESKPSAEPSAGSAPSADSEPTTETEPAPDFNSRSGSDTGAASPEPAESDDPGDPVDRRPERETGSAATDPVDGDAEHIDGEEAEDSAQASARSDVVSPDELDRAARETGSAAVDSESTEPPASQPGVDELRDELNEQFESIRIVSPGQYELNLMELYDRQEYIISLQEDGRYVIEMPDAWGVTDE